MVDADQAEVTASNPFSGIKATFCFFHILSAFQRKLKDIVEAKQNHYYIEGIRSVFIPKTKSNASM